MSVTNQDVSEILDEIADLLEEQNANEHRVRAYRSGADAVGQSEKRIARLYEEAGESGLRRIPGIGDALASVIAEVVSTGRSGLLVDLRTSLDPVEVFAGLPGIGEALARRIATELDVQSLAELEQAAHDGRLESVEGVGASIARGVRDALAARLGPSTRRRAEYEQTDEPPVALILEVDREYREKAAAGELRTIAPKRFNPSGKAWLPVMEEERGGWQFSLLFSNTKRAHELDKTQDWVVVYYKANGRESQCTVVTSSRGSLSGKRVIRGREDECREYYRNEA